MVGMGMYMHAFGSIPSQSHQSFSQLGSVPLPQQSKMNKSKWHPTPSANYRMECLLSFTYIDALDASSTTSTLPILKFSFEKKTKLNYLCNRLMLKKFDRQSVSTPHLSFFFIANVTHNKMTKRCNFLP